MEEEEKERAEIKEIQIATKERVEDVANEHA